MGFLSHYGGTERVDLDGGYWVDVKKCLSRKELEAAERALARTTVTPNGDETRTEIRPDSTSYRNEMMASAIVGWNLDDENGQLWPLFPDAEKRRNISRLPGPVFDQVWQTVDRLNAPAKAAERRTFRAGPVGGDTDGWAGPGDVVDVPNGAGVLAAAGPDAGGVGGPAVA